MAQVGPIKQRDKTITPDKNTFITKDQKLFADHAPCDMIHKPLLAKILAVKALVSFVNNNELQSVYSVIEDGLTRNALSTSYIPRQVEHKGLPPPVWSPMPQN